jgi:hypothetical protein
MPWELRDLQKLPRVVGQTYENIQLGLDGISYEKCTFRSCVLIYRGGPARASSCSIGPGCRFEFQDAAAMTLQLLGDLGWQIIPPGEVEKA